MNGTDSIRNEDRTLDSGTSPGRNFREMLARAGALRGRSCSHGDRADSHELDELALELGRRLVNGTGLEDQGDELCSSVGRALIEGYYKLECEIREG
jgi:hypothetical protein